MTLNTDALRERYSPATLDRLGKIRGATWRRINETAYGAHPGGATPMTVRFTTRCVQDRLHDGQKPLADCEWLVKLLTNEGDLVLDPFCGAGTIPLACANLGRRYVGVEIDPHFVAVSEKRLQDAARARNLRLPLEQEAGK